MIDNSLTFEPTTAVCRLPSPDYPSTPPFHPSAPYPEYRWSCTGETNLVYEALREIFRLLRLDAHRYGTPDWNPLKDIIRPGDSVVVKPNYVWHAHKYRPDEWEQVITHGSIVRAVVDYVLLALTDKGEVWIADGPQLDADWRRIIQRSGVKGVCEFYASATNVPVRLMDLRDEWLDVRGDVLYGRHRLPGDPSGATVVNLARMSRLAGYKGEGRYYGSDYSQAETNMHHSGERHEYRISRTVASADVIVNLPKMKTHKKVGVTLCLKNLVGINVGRNWLPHHTDGTPSDGGDQFPTPSLRNKTERRGVRRLQQLTLRHPRIFAPIFRTAKVVAKPLWGHTGITIRSGNWHGNDTCWRMVHDINRCTLYSKDADFPLQKAKRFFAVVDGIVAGQGNGPDAPDRLEAGVLVGGFNPVAVDCVTTRLMGFDPMKLAMLREAFAESELPLAKFGYQDIKIASNFPEWRGAVSGLRDDACYHFRPHFGWRGHIEKDDNASGK